MEKPIAAVHMVRLVQGEFSAQDKALACLIESTLGARIYELPYPHVHDKENVGMMPWPEKPRIPMIASTPGTLRRSPLGESTTESEIELAVEAWELGDTEWVF